MASANIGNHCGSLVLRRSGRAFSALLKLSSNAIFSSTSSGSSANTLRTLLHNSRCSSSGFFRLLMITLLYVNPFFRDYQSCLLGSFERVVTKLPVDLFNNRSRCSIKYFANWFPRKCAVIPFCCNSDNVAFVLFFHNAYSLSRLANVVLSKNAQSMKEKLGAEREPGPCNNF